MTKLQRLKTEARQSAINCGHSLGKFQTIKYWTLKTIYRAECKNCIRYVDVDPNPEPNEIEICGDIYGNFCNK